MDTVSEHIEHYIISAISSNKYEAGDNLPSERVLAAQINVNRCSLRTSLKALEKDGWIRINHGQPTQVMGFLENCQISAASQRIKYIDDGISSSIMGGACEAVFDIIQILLKQEFKKDSQNIIDLFNVELSGVKDFIEFETHLANELIKLTSNNVYLLLMNQLLPLYKFSAERCIDLAKVEERLKFYMSVKYANLSDPI